MYVIIFFFLNIQVEIENYDLYLYVIVKGDKKSPNLLTNYPTKPTYLINGQMGASLIRPN